ncbi:hypothetical protein BJY01DRAFT_245370 [Aspergillus pseudoustus]|uniref:BTB domain-containing protein n=1 Tax=Aspergillus pseudoustus TaxID=1810923 RepID=A0ABR4KEH8_9EURO
MAKKKQGLQKISVQVCERELQVAEPIPEIKVEDAEPIDPPFWYSPVPAYVPSNKILPKPALEDTNEVARLAIPEEGRPQRSPYEGMPITMFIGRSARSYVPENIANQIASLDDHQGQNDAKIARFPEVDDDIAHTLIHYLYEGNYETLRPALSCDMPKAAVGYTRSDIISVGRKYFPRISEPEWFSEYLTIEIMESFEMDKRIFEQEEFLAGFGEAPHFDRSLARVMGKAYAQQISSIRSAWGPMGDDL